MYALEQTLGGRKDEQNACMIFTLQRHMLYVHIVSAFRDQVGVIKGDRVHAFCLFPKISVAFPVSSTLDENALLEN